MMHAVSDMTRKGHVSLASRIGGGQDGVTDRPHSDFCLLTSVF